jgi:ribonucleoside-diphosphate reductase alpha chain
MSLTHTPPDGPVTLTSNARTVLEKRYLVKDKTGKAVESPEDMFWLVAKVVVEDYLRYGASEGAVQAVAEELANLTEPRPIHFSVGAGWLQAGGDPMDALRRADQAMYVHKAERRRTAD